MIICRLRKTDFQKRQQTAAAAAAAAVHMVLYIITNHLYMVCLPSHSLHMVLCTIVYMVLYTITRYTWFCIPLNTWLIWRPTAVNGTLLIALPCSSTTCGSAEKGYVITTAANSSCSTYRIGPDYKATNHQITETQKKGARHGLVQAQKRQRKKRRI